MKIAYASNGFFLRGDPNIDGKVDMADAILILNWLFLGNIGEPKCLDAADVDDNGKINLADAIGILSFLFLGEGRFYETDPDGFLITVIDPSIDDLGCLNPLIPAIDGPNVEQYLLVENLEEFNNIINNINPNGANVLLNELETTRDLMGRGEIQSVIIGVNSDKDLGFDFPLVYEGGRVVNTRQFGRFCSSDKLLNIPIGDTSTEQSGDNDAPELSPTSNAGCCEYKKVGMWSCKDVASEKECPGEITTTKTNIRYVPKGSCNAETQRCSGEDEGCCAYYCLKEEGGKKTWEQSCVTTKQNDCSCQKISGDQLCNTLNGVSEGFSCQGTAWSATAKCDDSISPGIDKCNGGGNICGHLSVLHSLAKLGLISKQGKNWDSQKIKDLQHLSEDYEGGLNIESQKKIYEKYGLKCEEIELTKLGESNPEDTKKACERGKESIEKSKDGKPSYDCSLFVGIPEVSHMMHVTGIDWKGTSCEIQTVNTNKQGNPGGANVPISPGTQSWDINSGHIEDVSSKDGGNRNAYNKEGGWAKLICCGVEASE